MVDQDIECDRECVDAIGVPTEKSVLRRFWIQQHREHITRPNRDNGFRVGDTIRMPHYETIGGYRVWLVQGVHLGGLFQEGTYRLKCVDVHDNETIHVPCIILETHPEIELV